MKLHYLLLLLFSFVHQNYSMNGHGSFDAARQQQVARLGEASGLSVASGGARAMDVEEINDTNKRSASPLDRRDQQNGGAQKRQKLDADGRFWTEFWNSNDPKSAAQQLRSIREELQIAIDCRDAASVICILEKHPELLAMLPIGEPLFFWNGTPIIYVGEKTNPIALDDNIFARLIQMRWIEVLERIFAGPAIQKQINNLINKSIYSSLQDDCCIHAILDIDSERLTCALLNNFPECLKSLSNYQFITLVENNKINTVRALLTLNFHADEENHTKVFSLSLFYSALQSRNSEMLELLKRSYFGKLFDQKWLDQALHLAVSKNDAESMEYLLKAGANEKSRSVYKQRTILHSAIKSGNISMLLFWWNKVPELRNATDKHGNTVLLSAANTLCKAIQENVEEIREQHAEKHHLSQTSHFYKSHYSMIKWLLMHVDDAHILARNVDDKSIFDIITLDDLLSIPSDFGTQEYNAKAIEAVIKALHIKDASELNTAYVLPIQIHKRDLDLIRCYILRGAYITLVARELAREIDIINNYSEENSVEKHMDQWRQEYEQSADDEHHGSQLPYKSEWKVLPTDLLQLVGEYLGATFAKKQIAQPSKTGRSQMAVDTTSAATTEHEAQSSLQLPAPAVAIAAALAYATQRSAKST